MRDASWRHQRNGASVLNGLDIRFTVIASVSTHFPGVTPGVPVNVREQTWQVSRVSSLIREDSSENNLVGTVNSYLGVVTLDDGLAAHHDPGFTVSEVPLCLTLRHCFFRVFAGFVGSASCLSFPVLLFLQLCSPFPGFFLKFLLGFPDGGQPVS